MKPGYSGLTWTVSAINFKESPTALHIAQGVCGLLTAPAR
jgi:hypothetical protein